MMSVQAAGPSSDPHLRLRKQFSKRRIAIAIGVLMLIQTALLVHSARVHSPTWDEVGHLAAGVSHWQLGRFDLYSVNPPLIRTLAAAPVALIAKPEFDWGFYRQAPQLRSEVFVGRRFIELHGEDSYRYFFHARLALLPLVLLGGWLCYLWARDLFGVGAGLVALFLWTLSPNVLAYGSIITPDLGAAVAMLGASYTFFRWLREPSASWATALAGALALAMLTKGVWLLLPVIYLLIWAGALAHCRFRCPLAPDAIGAFQSSRWYCTGGQLVAASAFALLLTNGFYGFAGSMKPLGQFEFVSTAFSANEPCDDCASDSTRGAIVAPGNRFAQTWLGKIPVPLPANYLQGIDIQTRDFERGRRDPGWRSYLFGQWQQGGWWYYYIVALLVKIPLPTWILLGIGSAMATRWRPDRTTLLGVACLWVPALVLFALVSVNTGVNRYMRYSLPVVPVLLIWASQVGRWIERYVPEGQAGRRRAVIPVLLCLWLAGTTLLHAPNYLSYFNLIAGGPSRGHEFLCDSNIDWGQDLIELKAWLDKNPEAAENLNLAYFGCYDPAWVGIKYRLPALMPVNAAKSPPTAQSSVGPLPGWYIVSKNYLVGHSMPVPDGSGRMHFRYFDSPFCDYLTDFDPIDEIGGSMLVYHLKLDEVNDARSARGLLKVQQINASRGHLIRTPRLVSAE
jgi:4-amino-4-deoxy-L-arabinose transferase-like glycosyltransferase